LLAEAPRQVINAVTLYALLKKWIDNNHSLELQSLLNSMSKDVIAKMMTYTMAFSFVIFVISFFMICVAAILYIPLLCHIQGNLKEYCCHKVDKR
jgi:Trk-type K+ transport system membrane component